MTHQREIRNYGFVVEIEGERVASFTEIKGLGLKIETIEYREGGGPSAARKLPGRASVNPIVLCQGISNSTRMWEWLMSTYNGTIQRLNISIIMLDFNGITEVMRWNCNDAWACEWGGLELNALDNEIAIEHITIQAESIERATDAASAA